MTPFSEKELHPAHTFADEIDNNAAVEARRLEGLDSGRLRRVESPCVAETITFASIGLYMRTHMWVWIVALLIIVGLSFTL